MMVDADLEAIREKRLEEMMNRASQPDAPKKSAPAAPVKVTDQTFDAFVAEHDLVLVDAWAPWCGPCRMVAPTLDQIASEQSGKVVVGKLNVDENPGTSMKYRIMSIPTLLVFKGGKLVDSLVGAHPKHNIMRVLEKHMG